MAGVGINSQINKNLIIEFYFRYPHESHGHLPYWDSGSNSTIDLSRDYSDAKILEELGPDSDIVRCINRGNTMGTSWKQIDTALQNLYTASLLRPVPVIEKRLYSNIDGESLSILNGSTADSNDDRHGFTYLADDEERMKRLDYIYENYLSRNRPVICHLKAWHAPGFGHYMVLTGWDKTGGDGNGTIHWADSLTAENKTCSYEEFISDYFFQSGCTSTTDGMANGSDFIKCSHSF